MREQVGTARCAVRVCKRSPACGRIVGRRGAARRPYPRLRSGFFEAFEVVWANAV